MGVKSFRSDFQSSSESAYSEWLRDNPEGFVVNALKSTTGRGNKSDARFTRIHRAACKTINPMLSQAEKTGFTTGRYQKLCTTSLDLADNEARIITGLTNIKRCPCI
ncbi:hypothetical protein [Pseudescherichia sp.]|uniref:hypothetical protein n=1 Tax=Pseudescherichia sp. TaxID=2055881 RepID=UPI0028A1D1F7|nr:hypothetical protein [Pseudescherichia sp.]